MGRAGRAATCTAATRSCPRSATYPQVTTLINRIDWLGSFANEVPFILAAEKLMGIEAPPRAQWIRTMLFEMARIANLILFLGDMGAQLGALTPVFYAFRDREYVLNLIEAATGGRFHPNFDRIGGLKDDLPKGWIDETKAVMQRLRGLLRRDRRPAHRATRSSRRGCRGIGVIPQDIALEYGLSGANVRASGVDWDLRRDEELAAGVEASSTGRSGPIPTATASPATGSACRRSARRPRSSTSCSTACRPGPSRPRCPRIIKVPEGEAWVHTENPLGEMGYYVVSKGGPGPFRCKIRTPSFNNVSIAPVAAAGRLRARRHHHPGQPLLHPRGHRPVTIATWRPSTSPYWESTLIKVVLRPGRGADRGARIIVQVFLFKMMAHMQSRLGPMEAGPHGSLQLMAEVAKFVQKEDCCPGAGRPAGLRAGARSSC